MARIWFALALWLMGCGGAAPGPSATPARSGQPESGSTATPLPTSPGGTAAATGSAPGSAGSAPPASDKPPPRKRWETPEQPIRKGLARMPGYQSSLRVVNTRRGQAATVPSGFKLYASLCASCHMKDLSGQNRDPKHRSLPVRDLREPRFYKYGATDQALFRTIRFGIPRTAMGSYEKSLSEQQTWDLVNFVKSRWTTSP